MDNDAEEASHDEVSEDGEVSVSVDAPSTWHADWNDWQAYFTGSTCKARLRCTASELCKYCL